MASQPRGRARLPVYGGQPLTIEYGSVDFSTTDLNVNQATSLNIIDAGFCMTTEYASAKAGAEIPWIDNSITTGVVAINRADDDTSGATWSYVLMGGDKAAHGSKYAKISVRGMADIELQWGTKNFTTTGTTTEVATLLDNVQCAIVIANAYTDTGDVAASEGAMYCDKTVSSQAVTVQRKASQGSADGFNFLFVGGRTSNWPTRDTNGEAVLVELESFGAEPVYIQFGFDKFTTSGSATSIEVSTPLASVQAAIVTMESFGSTGNGEGIVFCDRTVSSNAVTVQRKVGTATNEQFSYMFIGQK